jgi:hypothetical protein
VPKNDFTGSAIFLNRGLDAVTQAPMGISSRGVLPPACWPPLALVLLPPDGRLDVIRDRLNSAKLMMIGKRSQRSACVSMFAS